MQYAVAYSFACLQVQDQLHIRLNMQHSLFFFFIIYITLKVTLLIFLLIPFWTCFIYRNTALMIGKP